MSCTSIFKLMPLFYSVAEQQWAGAPDPMQHCLGNGLSAFSAVNSFCHGDICIATAAPTASHGTCGQGQRPCPSGRHNLTSGRAFAKLLALRKQPVCKSTTRPVPKAKPCSEAFLRLCCSSQLSRKVRAHPGHTRVTPTRSKAGATCINCLAN